MSQKLEDLRRELDAINEGILHLLNDRAALVAQIGDVKESQGVDRYDPIREKEQLDRLTAMNEGPFDDQTVRHLFKQIFQASLGLMDQKKEKQLLVSRKAAGQNTIVDVKGIQVGNGKPVIVAGPCSVETPQQMDTIGKALNGLGIRLLRGGAYKPRTSPYDFQGLGVEGLKLLHETGKRYGMATISEIMTPSDVDIALDYLDVIQIGARNMQNFELLKAVGSVKKPVLLKRGLAATIEELLYAAEYIMDRGNGQIILCERGIRTYEKATRNTLDISAVPILKQETHLPILVDVTHAAGRRDILLPLAKAALAVGADGVMVETHPEPSVALSDAKQQLDIPQFTEFLQGLKQSGLLPEATLSYQK